jgi:hypothetical protein
MPILLDPWTLKQAALDLDCIIQADRLDELHDCLQYTRSQQRGYGQTVNEELHVAPPATTRTLPRRRVGVA